MRTNVFVRYMDVEAHNNLDARRLEVVAGGLPLFRDGTARRGASRRPGVALEIARKLQERTYPEHAGEGGRAKMVVLATATGGTWSAETVQFVSELTFAKVRDLPEELQAEAARSWKRRWHKMLSCVAAKSFVLSLLDRAHEVICDDRFSRGTVTLEMC